MPEKEQRPFPRARAPESSLHFSSPSWAVNRRPLTLPGQPGLQPPAPLTAPRACLPRPPSTHRLREGKRKGQNCPSNAPSPPAPPAPAVPPRPGHTHPLRKDAPGPPPSPAWPPPPPPPAPQPRGELRQEMSSSAPATERAAPAGRRCRCLQVSEADLTPSPTHSVKAWRT